MNTQLNEQSSTTDIYIATLQNIKNLILNEHHSADDALLIARDNNSELADSSYEFKAKLNTSLVILADNLPVGTQLLLQLENDEIITFSHANDITKKNIQGFILASNDTDYNPQLQTDTLFNMMSDDYTMMITQEAKSEQLALIELRDEYFDASTQHPDEQLQVLTCLLLIIYSNQLGFTHLHLVTQQHKSAHDDASVYAQIDAELFFRRNTTHNKYVI